MLPDTKIRLKQEIEISLGKYPDAQIRDFSEFLENGSIAFLNTHLKKTSFSMFLKDIS